MESDNRVVGEIRGQKVWVHRSLVGLQPSGDYGIKAAADMDEITCGHMLLEGSLARKWASGP